MEQRAFDICKLGCFVVVAFLASPLLMSNHSVTSVGVLDLDRELGHHAVLCSLTMNRRGDRYLRDNQISTIPDNFLNGATSLYELLVLLLSGSCIFGVAITDVESLSYVGWST